MIEKNSFDAALVPGFRELVKKSYSEMAPAQSEFTSSLKQRVSDPSVWNTRVCPVCAANQHVPLSTHTYEYGVQIVKCISCNFIYTAQVLYEQYDKYIYEGNEHLYEAYLRLKTEPVYQKIEQKKAQYIIQTANRFVTEKGSFLDVGSAVGSVVSAAQMNDWNAVGVEANPLFLKESRSRGLSIIHGFFPDALSADNRRFNAISMLDVLEHIIEPVSFLQSVKKYLASPDSILLIQVPNLNSLFIQLDGEKNNNYCVGHWSYFTPETLNMVLEKAGFKNLFQETYISELDKIKQFSEADIQQTITQLTGKTLHNIDELTTNWLHKNLLGYKVFGVYKASA